MPSFTRKRPRAATRTVAVADPGHLGFDYQIRYSARKTLSLQVREGSVRLAAPHHACPKELQQWLDSKLEWVRTKLADQQQRQLEIPHRKLCQGETLPLLGRSLELCIEQTGQRSRSSVQLQGDQLRLRFYPNPAMSHQQQVRGLLEQWYKAQARALLAAKTRQVCAGLGVQASDIRLRKTISKWGHCTPAGVIQYNWLILQAPEAVVDYLVTHECCHLVHLNHSKQFWALVQRVMPGYREPRRWLRDNGHTLVL